MKKTGVLLLLSALLVGFISITTPLFANPVVPPNPDTSKYNPSTGLASAAVRSGIFLPAVERGLAPAPPPTQPPPSGQVLVYCDGKTYDGYTNRLFVLDSAVDHDPRVQKIIRNCVFRNSSIAPIAIHDAQNVLIEGNTFDNIRTNQAGVGVHGINLTGPTNAGGTIDNITIRNNKFSSIGADGIQLGQNTRQISHVYIQNNQFTGGTDVGENAVDVKGVIGPIYITGNTVHGFRPCESPKTNPPGNQDCTGSNGPGITIHDGGDTSTPATNVTIENNELYDNIYGLNVSSGTQGITVRGNNIHDNKTAGILLDGVYSIVVMGNTLNNDPTHIKVGGSPLSGGSCTINSNTFLGAGTPLALSNSNCK